MGPLSRQKEPTMIAEGDRRGVSTLRLLAEGSTIRILRELRGGPLRPVELGQRLSEVGHSALMRRLGELVTRRAVVHQRIGGLSPRAYYSLAPGGSALLGVAGAAECWERQWPALTQLGAKQSEPAEPGSARWGPADSRPSGMRALGLLADERAMAIVRALAAEPLRPIDLERCLPEVSRAATRRRLGPLVQGGILVRADGGPPLRYALAESTRSLEPIAMLAAQWEWRWASSLTP
jgi:DNA-binding HxlR family transcriptional regulator